MYINTRSKVMNKIGRTRDKGCQQMQTNDEIAQ